MKLKNNLNTLFYLGFDACIFPGEQYEVNAERWDKYKSNPVILHMLKEGQLTFTDDSEIVEKPKKAKKESNG